ncbi:hypothetical protein Tco_0605645 [Tanacetum coccineum]
MHNNIMQQVQGIVPPMLATGRYCTLGDTRFLRYIDTRPNGVPYGSAILTVLIKNSNNEVTTPAVPATRLLQKFLQKHSRDTQEMWKAIEGYKTRSASEEDCDPAPRCSDRQRYCRRILALLQIFQETLQTYPITTSELPQKKLRNKKWITNSKGTRMIIRLDSLGNQRAINGCWARETVGWTSSATVWINSCFKLQGNLVIMLRNAESQNGLRRLPRITRKMLLCQPAEKGVSTFKQSNLTGLEQTTDEKLMNRVGSTLQYMQRSRGPNADSGTDAEPLNRWKRVIETVFLNLTGYVDK